MVKRSLANSNRLVCFNNFYYCRWQGLYYADAEGQYASIISTIVDQNTILYRNMSGQYASIISTIVDMNDSDDEDEWASMLQ